VDRGLHNFASEWSKGYHTKGDLKILVPQMLRKSKSGQTVYVDRAITTGSQTIRRAENIPQADAEPDILYDSVGILDVNIVFNCLGRWLSELLRCEGNHVGNGRLFSVSDNACSGRLLLTRTYISDVDT
jgi:hypothetical protein